ncbi:class I SAM-dependent methyltransferase [Corynebacterium sp. HS2168-gen11]|uniref:class I SAM-dependent methyltransferase n=1 Tax=Corynebacterium sp. HS2168-gen11 TaxID=2974027 RepID=UPI00216B5834|nr:class I SAM-dependent methyltransferase [Corynebacterium sp. HS2168-gen11]MCS4534853.1 class I SAM-dependent methyltransferase [Corynebacterium sp. HS2168-gen11]
MSVTVDEVRFLLAHDAHIMKVAASLPLTKASALDDATAFRQHFGTYGRAAMELARARASTTGKLPPEMFMCAESAQQATPMAVANYRAQKLSQFARDIHDVTCSIGTEGVALAEAGLSYTGADLDRARLEMARANVPAARGFFQADALLPARIGADVIIADPARRAGGTRIVKPEDLLPSLPDLLTQYQDAELAIKCAPGLDFSKWEGLVSVVSVAGGVKEACLYTPGLAQGVRREAVVIGNANGQEIIDVITDATDASVESGEPGRYILDPDGAIVRAGLVQHYAAREGLWMLDPRIAYLTGERLPAHTSGFEYRETVPIKRLKAALRNHDAGSIEILVRGVQYDPDQLRKKLALKGSQACTVVLTRIGSQGVAMICGPRVQSQA